MWKWSYVLEILPPLLHALWLATQATVLGFAAACAVGLPLALARRSKRRWLSASAAGFIEFVRSTPLLVQLFFLYFSLPMLIGLALPSMAVAVVGLGLHYGTYLSEVYRSGIEAIPKGQWEAAKALNLTRSQTWRQIILPQAIPPVIPVMGNYLIVMFKETPLLSAVSLGEMLLVSKQLISESYRPFEPYTLIGVLFLVVSLPASWLVRWAETKLNRDRR